MGVIAFAVIEKERYKMFVLNAGIQEKRIWRKDKMIKEIKVPEHMKKIAYCDSCKKRISLDEHEAESGLCISCSDQKTLGEF